MMRWFRPSHPDDTALSRWLDDGAPATGGATARHVATCDRCTRRTDAWLALRKAARALADVPDEAPPGLLDRLRATRMTTPPARVRPIPMGRPAAARHRSLLTAAAVVLVAVGLTWDLWQPDRLDAGLERGRLTVGGAGLRPGTTVSLRYEPIPALAEADSVMVRMRVMTDAIEDAGAVLWAQAVLHREGTAFAGSWPFPRDGALAVAAVDGFDSVTVDANGDRLFLLLAQDSSGRPTVGALFQALTMHSLSLAPWRRLADQRQASRDSVLRAMLRQHHPDTPERWAIDGSVRAEANWVSFLKDFAQRTLALARLDRRLAASSGLPWRTRFAMQQLAEQQEEPEVAAEWEGRLPPRRPPKSDLWDTVALITSRRDTVAARAIVRDPSSADREILMGLFLYLGPYRRPWGRGAGLLSCREVMDAAEAAARRPMPPLHHRRLGLSLREIAELVRLARERDLALAQWCGQDRPWARPAQTPLEARSLRLYWLAPTAGR